MFGRIAFLKLCCPGDILFTTPAVRAVKRRFPAARLFYLTGQYSSFVPEHNPHIEKTLVVQPPFEAGGKARATMAVVRGIAMMRRNEFDLMITFHRSRAVASMAVLARAGKVLGFSTARPLVSLYTRFDPRQHEVQRYLDLVLVIGANSHERTMEYKTTPEEDSLASELLSGNGISGRFAVIAPGGGENPGTTMHTKRWPVQHFRTVARDLRSRYGLPAVAVGSVSEKGLGDRVEADVNLAGKTSFPLLAAVLKKAAIVIGNDSGPLYLASAVGTKTVGTYGPSSADLVEPFSTNHQSVVSPVWCQPCYRPQGKTRGNIMCPTGTWACMLTLQPDMVLTAVDRLMTAGGVDDRPREEG